MSLYESPNPSPQKKETSKPKALERPVPGTEHTIEEQKKLQIRSASQEEWNELFTNIEHLDESPKKKEERLRLEQLEQRQSKERERIRQEAYEYSFLMTMQAMERDPAFQKLNDSQKLARAFEESFQKGLDILKPDFPNEDESFVGARVLAAYGNFVINNIQLDPSKRVSALQAGDLIAQRIIESRKNMGLISQDEPDRSKKTDFREIRLGQTAPSTTTFIDVEKTPGRQASTQSEGGLINLAALQAQESTSKKARPPSQSSENDTEDAFTRIQRPPASETS